MVIQYFFCKGSRKEEDEEEKHAADARQDAEKQKGKQKGKQKEKKENEKEKLEKECANSVNKLNGKNKRFKSIKPLISRMSFRTNLSCFSFTCSTQPEELTKRLRSSNKILLPPSVLYELNQQDLSDNIMFFKVSNKELNFGIVCGVQEFSSPPGICHIPYHIMEHIGIKEAQEVEIEKVSLDQGSYIKLRPHKTAFINLSNPKEILEKVMSSDYPVVSQGQTIEIYYEEIKYLIDIVETKPDVSISIINTDINIDFEEPLDYVEPIREPIQEPIREPDKTNAQHFVPFTGQGNRLGTN